MPDFQSSTVNSPLEAALRTLVILCHVFPSSLDSGNLASLDYLLVHTADLNGPKSIHPATPYRSGEMLVRKELTEKGVHLLVSRGLAEVSFCDEGIMFCAKDLGAMFLDSLSSPYVEALRGRAIWLTDLISQHSLQGVIDLINEGLTAWGGEFAKEALFEESIA